MCTINFSLKLISFNFSYLAFANSPLILYGSSLTLVIITTEKMLINFLSLRPKLARKKGMMFFGSEKKLKVLIKFDINPIMLRKEREGDCLHLHIYKREMQFHWRLIFHSKALHNVPETLHFHICTHIECVQAGPNITNYRRQIDNP